MHRDHKVIAWTPYGRRQTVELLAAYLRRDHAAGLIDEWWLCMNTDADQEADIEYASELADTYRWVKLKERIGPNAPPHWRIPADWRLGVRDPKQLNTGRFYWYMTGRDHVYVRFDDDIVWVHDRAVRRLVDQVLDNPETMLACFPTIWNNSLSSWWLQNRGHLPVEWGVVGKGRQPWDVSAIDPVGWADPKFAEKLHGLLLDRITAGTVEETFTDELHSLSWTQQFSVSCFAIRGEVLAEIGGIINWDEEEHWLTQHYPHIVKRGNFIAGDAAVSHLTFFPQREYLLRHTDVLARYQRLARALTAELDAEHRNGSAKPKPGRRRVAASVAPKE